MYWSRYTNGKILDFLISCFLHYSYQFYQEIIHDYNTYLEKVQCVNHSKHKNIFLLQVTSPDGGWITKSNLSLRVDPMDRNKDVFCYAINTALGETIVEKHTVAVLCKYNCPLSVVEEHFSIILLIRK